MIGPYCRYADGGRKFYLEPKGLRLEGVPRDIQARTSGQPEDIGCLQAKLFWLADGQLMGLAHAYYFVRVADLDMPWVEPGLGHSFSYGLLVANQGDVHSVRSRGANRAPDDFAGRVVSPHGIDSDSHAA